MSLQENIKEDIKKSLIAKDSSKLSVLRMLQAALQGKEKDKRNKIFKEDPEKSEAELVKAAALTDEEVIDTLMSEIKKRKDSIEQYEKGGRKDLAEVEKSELDILMVYAPEQMSEEEITKIVQAAIKKTGAAGAKEIGKVMSVIMPQVKGKADGSLVSKIVQAELSK